MGRRFVGAQGWFDPPTFLSLRGQDDFNRARVWIQRQLRLGFARDDWFEGILGPIIPTIQIGAAFTQRSARPDGMAVRTQLDHHAAAVTKCRRKVRGILEHLEVIFVRAIPNVEFRLERFAADLAVLPVPLVPVLIVKRANRVAVVVACATVPRVGEQDVFVMVVADPIAAATGPHQILRLAAQAAAGFG